MNRLIRRDNVQAPRWAWLLQDVTNVVVSISFNVLPDLLWPQTYRAVARLDDALIAHHVWTVE